MPKITASILKDKKQKREKITCLTAYDAPTAMLLDQAGIDIVLVGDSVGNVLLGYDGTVSVTMADMLHHTKAAASKVRNSMLAADMPLEAFSGGDDYALECARRLIGEAGANAVKIEGILHLSAIKKIITSNIPVIAHVGHTPQSIDASSAKILGKTPVSADRLIEEAKQLEAEGAFAVVLELVEREAAGRITAELGIPTIGIGSGPHCDGQVLVTHDMVGLYPGKVPKFVKQYANLGDQFRKAVSEYIDEVKTGMYPE